MNTYNVPDHFPNVRAFLNKVGNAASKTPDKLYGSVVVTDDGSKVAVVTKTEVYLLDVYDMGNPNSVKRGTDWDYAGVKQAIDVMLVAMPDRDEEIKKFRAFAFSAIRDQNDKQALKRLSVEAERIGYRVVKA